MQRSASTPIILDGSPLTFGNLARIGARAATLVPDDEAMRRVDAARKVVDDKIARGEPVYGATTGVGAMKDVEWSPEDVETFNMGLVRAHHFGTGAPFPNSVVRSAMAIRVNTALTGRVGCSRGLVEAFKAHPGLLFKRHLRTVFIWWNVCFLPMDVVFTFVFIPGLVLAAFGQFYVVGPLTLAVLPLALIWNLFIFRIQRRTFHLEHLKVRRNIRGFLFYALGYNLLVQPICVLGYASELVGLRKTWGTK